MVAKAVLLVVGLLSPFNPNTVYLRVRRWCGGDVEFEVVDAVGGCC